VQPSTQSNVCTLLETEPNKIRDTTHTPAVGIDEEKDMVNLVGRLALSPHSCRSAVTPISALPPELLMKIFRFYALQVPPWYRVSESTRRGIRRRGWIAVTHVCRRWRQVALGDSSLWARITGSSLSSKWIAEMLVRARNAPLILDFAVTPFPEVLSKFTPHIFRIRELRLRGLSAHSRVLREICALEAPSLEHFELGVSSFDTRAATFHQLGGTTLFRGLAPELRTLSLSKVSIPWSLIPRGQFTQLKIILPRWSTPPSDLNQLLDLLINSPDLEVLVLEFCLPTILFQAPDGQAIHLPRLSCLCLGGSTSRVANLLKMLQLPSSTTLRLRCMSEDPSTDNVNIVLPRVSANFPVGFRSLRITVNSLNGPIYMAASIAHPDPTISGLYSLECYTDDDAELTMSFNGLSSFGHSTKGDILEGVFSMLPISNLEFLSVSVLAFDPSINWYDLSQCCEKVTRIRASGRGTSGLLRLLAPLSPTQTTSGSKGENGRCVNGATRLQGAIRPAGGHAAILFPELTSLLLENLDFNFAMDQYGVLYDVIAHVLRWRRENNMPLNILDVVHCVITPDRAEGLKKYVQELRWDGDEGTPTK